MCSREITAVTLIISIIINEIIDIFGHEYYLLSSHSKRLQITHSLIGVLMIAAVITGLFQVMLLYLNYPYEKSAVLIWPALASGLSHLFLDALNPSGVYICGKRVRIARIRYNNPLANLVLQIIGILLLCYGLC